MFKGLHTFSVSIFTWIACVQVRAVSAGIGCVVHVHHFLTHLPGKDSFLGKESLNKI